MPTGQQMTLQEAEFRIEIMTIVCLECWREFDVAEADVIHSMALSAPVRR
jgi:hypothetical protein